MSKRVVDANEAVASVAHRVSEVVAIYPITPASAMGELCDAWSASGRTNVWGAVPRVIEMQSEAGAAGVLHGALQAGALATTFTASQGLLLMIPDLYKIAGELTPMCLHVAARAIATHALSIFGDHSDVMACRAIGLAMLASNNAQEAHDLAAIAHAATLASRVPFLHFFDGFRTSHEVRDIELLEDEELRALLDEPAIAAHRARALTPDHPVVRGTAQNPDAFFQGREAANPFYDVCPAIVQRTMDLFAERFGRRYQLFEWTGPLDADRAIVIMGSGAEAVKETVTHLTARGERVGVLNVRLFRPFDARALARALPETVRSIAVLDRTKEPGALGDPLFLDVVAALAELGRSTRVIGGRYGLASKELSPAMVLAIYDALAGEAPPRRFTIGIEDDVTKRSLPWDRAVDIEQDDVERAVFYGIGADGTVGAVQMVTEVIGQELGRHVQAFFEYDSRKSGTTTVSHVRVAARPITSTYRPQRAQFIGVHQPILLERIEVLERAADGATLLLNVRGDDEQVWDALPREVQDEIARKRLRVYAVDASRIAREAGLGAPIGTAMLACFLALGGRFDVAAARAALSRAVERAFEKKAREILTMNLAVMDRAVDELREVAIPERRSERHRRPPITGDAPSFVQRVTAALLAGHGDALPVSAFPVDGTWPVGTSRFEKRALATELPAVDLDVCIQCNKCTLFCPHAALRAKVVEEAPATLPSAPFHSKEHPDHRYLLQLSPDDCTGCGLCAAVCPAKDKKNPTHRAISMVAANGQRDVERARWEAFDQLPSAERARVHLDIKGSQFVAPQFEFSGACTGCGETPYVKLLTQLFGDRLMIANATGCSSIYGGNLPTSPWSTDEHGRGPAWSNSLFEDDAEFGLGFRLALDARTEHARTLLRALAPRVGDALVAALLDAAQEDDAAIAEQRARVAALRTALRDLDAPGARVLERLADDLVRKTVWIVGGDGWAYDIGYGGLDHVISTTHDVNILVLDSEVYSNTGGQQSKATPLGAAAKFAASGKETSKKDLGLQAMTYGHAYVAQIALGANDAHAVKVLREAESYHGPSLVIAHAPCIAHGYALDRGPEHQKLAVATSVWPLYRWDPRRIGRGEPPLSLDSAGKDLDIADWMATEDRFRAIERKDPERYAAMVDAARRALARKKAYYANLAQLRL